MNDASQDVSRLVSEQVKALLKIGLRSRPRAPSDRSLQALVRSLADSDRAVNHVLHDLQAPVLSADQGPLSFQRLTGIRREEAAALKGKTFLRVLCSSGTTRTVLQCLATYGDMLTTRIFPDTTRITGLVIRTLAVGALSTRYQADVASEDILNMSDILDSFKKSASAPKALRELRLPGEPKP